VLKRTASDWSSELGPTGGAADGDGIAESDTADYENAPIRSTAYDVPGFDPVVTLLAIAVASLLARRRP